MNNSVYKYAFVGVACLFLSSLAACHEEALVVPNEESAAIPVAIEAGYPSQTRATTAGFVDGDAIGVYVVDYEGESAGELMAEGNRGNNVKYTLDEAAYRWQGSIPLYYKNDHTPVDVYGYYPYQTEVTEVTAYPFTVRTDQNSLTDGEVMAGYEASDFLWGKSERVMPTREAVNLYFEHRMASLCISLVEGTGFAEGEWGELEKLVIIPGLKRQAEINLQNGEVKAVGEVSVEAIVPYLNQDTYQAIVVPQAVEAGKALLVVTVGGVNYRLVKSETISYLSGKMHQFTITVDKTAATGDYTFTLSNEAVTAWETDPELHESLVRQYLHVEVPEEGTLQATLESKGLDYTTIQSLRLTGNINKEDIYFMRDNMTALSSLNLKDVNLTDKVIPYRAFYNMAQLINFVFPDKLEEIESEAFRGTHLIGSLILPEGLKTIGTYAFYYVESLKGALILPQSLSTIEGGAFAICGFASDLLIPQGIKTIGSGAFRECTSMTGNLTLPEGLSRISGSIFGYLSKMTGDIVIPKGVKEIGEEAFLESGFDGNVVIPEGVEYIGNGVFQGTSIKGELRLPSTLIKIGMGTNLGANVGEYGGAFEGTYISGSLLLPRKLIDLGDKTFKNCDLLTGIIDIPESCSRIGKETFYGCSQIEEIIIPEEMEIIEDGAFAYCSSLHTIICNAKEPPAMYDNSFLGVQKGTISVEVPKGCVNAYKADPYWREFARISEYRGFVCRPLKVSALNKAHTQELILNADAAWEVEHLPAWCSLSATEGSLKTALTLDIEALPQGAGNRVDSIVFRLAGEEEYRTVCQIKQYDYEYAEDEVITLQEATRGKGIDILFMGDGWDAESIADGKYMELINEQYQHFFGIEPFQSYHEYFNVYAAVALSQETGINTLNTYCDTKFETIFSLDSRRLIPTASLVVDYALKTGKIKKDRLAESLLIIVPNSVDYGGATSFYDDGTTIAVCSPSNSEYPNDTRGILQHEACGHGFGKLADERILCGDMVNDAEKLTIKDKQRKGWYQNISLSGKMNKVPWSHLIFDDRYSDIVDIFEGAYGVTRGVYRSEVNSCMNYGIPYFSTISRQDMVKRIMEYAGEEFSLEKFFEKDSRRWGSTTNTRSMETPWDGYTARGSHREPMFVNERPSEQKPVRRSNPWK